MEPESAEVSHILVGEEEKAHELLKRIREGADFAGLAKEFSLDPVTRGTGGKIEGGVYRGYRAPFTGDVNELNAAIFAAEAPKVLEQPFKTETGWEIIRVDGKRPPRQQDFEEVRQQVRRDLLRRKGEEVQREYMQELMDKHKVIIHTSVLTPAQQETTEKAPAQQ
jgi:parvulin-like peptidyl-prolyl isomerase